MTRENRGKQILDITEEICINDEILLGGKSNGDLYESKEDVNEYSFHGRFRCAGEVEIGARCLIWNEG